MNMIPLVMANEPGEAQFENLSFAANCSLQVRLQVCRRCKSLWKKTSERVKIPSFAGRYIVRNVSGE